MTRSRAIVLAVAGLAGLSMLPAAAQETIDCEAPEGVGELEACAADALTAAEAELDETYRLALIRAEVLQEEWGLRGGVPEDLSIHDTLAAAQADWVAYRDRACAVESLRMTDEAAVRLALLSCLERLTRHRGADLALLGEDG